jgi:signal transduction histidine kinase
VGWFVAAFAAALMLANLVVTVPLLDIANVSRSLTSPSWTAMALVLSCTLPLAWRRRAPLLVLVIAVATYWLYLTLGFPPVHPFAPAIAVYTVAATSIASVAATGAAGTALLAVLAQASQSGWLLADLDDLIFVNALLIGTACMLGYGVQLSRARKSMLTEQAARLAREQSEAVQLAIREEQARIARELHDIVAHHVSVITAQAAGAQTVFDSDTELVRQALQSIEALGRSALTEMRRLLDVVHAEAEYTPAPLLDQLPSLLARMDRAGLPVELEVHGAARPLPAGFELNAFRIVQEALTNTLEHAGEQATAHVDLRYHPGGLERSVRDDGIGFGEHATVGHGLIGMKQRTALLGGELAIRSGADRGVEVQVTLPSHEPAR